MSTPPERPDDLDVAALLQEAGWVRALARRLAVRASDADDVAQGTMALALEKRPPVGRGLRPWLARVTRRVAQQGVRSEVRRRDREVERMRTSPGHSPGAEELFERLEAQESLAAHVRALPAPYAEVLLRRYYEGQTPEAIAASMDTTSATVRSQISRALARLRRSIASEHSVHSGGVLTFLAMAAGSDVALMSPAATEVVTMKVSSKTIALCAAALLGASTLTFVAVEGGRDHDPAPEIPGAEQGELASVTGPERADAGLGVATEDVERTEATEVAKLDSSRPAATPAPPPAYPPILARIVDENGTPLGDARLSSIYKDGRPRGQGNEAIASEEGVVRLELQDAALRMGRTEVYSMVFAASHEGRATVFTAATPTRRGTSDLGDIELGPGGRITGTAVDESGTPVPGVLAYTGPAVLGDDRESLELTGPDRSFARPRADGAPSGTFEVRGVPVGRARLWVHAPGRLWTITDPLEIRAGQTTDVGRIGLAPVPDEWTIRGIVTSPGGTPYAGATVVYSNGYADGDTTSNGDGSFALYPTSESVFDLVARTPGGPHGISEIVRARPGEEVVLRLSPRHVIEVIATDPHGVPIEEASTSAFIASDPSTGRAYHDDFRAVPGWRWVRTDENGRATIVAPADRFYVSASKSGYAIGRSEPIEAGNVPETLAIVLEPDPMITGRVTHEGQPVRGARVEVAQRIDGFFPREYGFTHRLFGSSATDVRTDTDGRFEVPVDEDHTEVSVLATADGLATAELELTLAPGEGAENVEIAMLGGGSVRGMLLPPAGEDPAKLFVAASRGDGQPVWVRPDESGRYVIRNLTPGPWRIEGRDREPSNEYLSVANRPEDKEFGWNVEIVDRGETVFDVDMRQLGDVAVHGRLTIDGHPAEGWTVTATQPMGTTEKRRPPSAQTGEDGRFSFDVRSGEYELELKGTLPGGGKVVMIRPVTLSGARFDWEGDLRTAEIEEEVGEGATCARFVRGRYYDGDREITTFDALDDGRVVGRVPCGTTSLQRPSANSRFPDAWSSVRTVEVGR